VSSNKEDEPNQQLNPNQPFIFLGNGQKVFEIATSHAQ